MRLAAEAGLAAGVTEAAPAKVNLALHVTGLRGDGYHALGTIAVFTCVGDAMTVSSAERDAFSVTGPFAADVPQDEGNLVLKAKTVVRRFALDGGEREAFLGLPPGVVGGAAGGPVSVALRKNLPVASGLGGGSSDAAAMLRALDRLWGLKLSRDRLAALGTALGADVPMCVHARPLAARGIGEAIEALATFPALDLVLVNPGVPVSTPAVFAALARKQNPPLRLPPKAATAADIRDWLAETRNDLEAPAIGLCPAIAAAKAALDEAGALFSRMSGSGATCFGLFNRSDDARVAAAALRQAHPSWWVKATRTLSALPREVLP